MYNCRQYSRSRYLTIVYLDSTYPRNPWNIQDFIRGGLGILLDLPGPMGQIIFDTSIFQNNMVAHPTQSTLLCPVIKSVSCIRLTRRNIEWMIMLLPSPPNNFNIFYWSSPNQRLYRTYSWKTFIIKQPKSKLKATCLTTDLNPAYIPMHSGTIQPSSIFCFTTRPKNDHNVVIWSLDRYVMFSGPKMEVWPGPHIVTQVFINGSLFDS